VCVSGTRHPREAVVTSRVFGPEKHTVLATCWRRRRRYISWALRSACVAWVVRLKKNKKTPVRFCGLALNVYGVSCMTWRIQYVPVGLTRVRSASLVARYLEIKTRRFFDFLCAPPFLFPRVHPRLTRRLIKTGAPGKKTGWLKHLAGCTRKKASTRRVNRKIADLREINEFSFQGILQPTTVPPEVPGTSGSTSLMILCDPKTRPFPPIGTSIARLEKSGQKYQSANSPWKLATPVEPPPIPGRNR